jgi:hypothetical protein
MERLTFEGNFCDIAQCRELPCKYDGNCTQKEVWERLKAYEDSRLSPQACAEAREIEETLSDCDYSISRMVELMKADKEGRLVVLPCKVGDTVYFVNKQILEFAVVGYAVDETGISWVYSEHVDKTGHTYERTFSPDRIGKTTFLSREEAEKASQEMEGKKDGNETSM